jgi:CO dehydrogenase/acetyl-CoA synthase epsilon subunit
MIEISKEILIVFIKIQLSYSSLFNFKAGIARNLFLMILVKFQNDPWPGFNLSVKHDKLIFLKSY